MNNPVRSLIQRRYEGRLLEALGGRTVNVEVLEIGCGRGVGTEIILQRFGARRVVAFDFDSKMAELARRRLRHFPACRVLISVADAAAIPARDASFDAVFDFGAIHHVPNWRAAVSEVRRVLRPDGRFFFEEVTRHALDRWSYRTFLEHPREDRFTGEEFIAELERHDLMVGSNHRYWFFGDFIVGAARLA